VGSLPTGGGGGVAKGELDIGVAAHLAVLAPFADRRVDEILRRIQGWSRGRGGRQERDRAASPTRQGAAGRQLSSAHRSGSRWRRPHPGDHRPNPRAQSKPTTTIGLRPIPRSQAISRCVRPLVCTRRTASSSNSFVNRRCCVIEFLIAHGELSTFPRQVHDQPAVSDKATEIPPMPAEFRSGGSPSGLQVAGFSLQRENGLNR
jgi:hypothetical protein